MIRKLLNVLSLVVFVLLIVLMIYKTGLTIDNFIDLPILVFMFGGSLCLIMMSFSISEVRRVLFTIENHDYFLKSLFFKSLGNYFETLGFLSMLMILIEALVQFDSPMIVPSLFFRGFLPVVYGLFMGRLICHPIGDFAEKRIKTDDGVVG